MYTRLAPELRKLDPNMAIAGCYYGDVDKGPIILEDLKERSFKMASRKKGIHSPTGQGMSQP